MRWKIEGFGRESGDEQQIWLEASSRDHAIEKAGDHNIVVSDAYEVSPVLQVELDRRQMQILQVTPLEIGGGVFIGLLLWTVFVAVLAAIFWFIVILGFMWAV